jgi:hypothetical protein
MSDDLCAICYGNLTDENSIYTECCIKKMDITCLYVWVIFNKNKTCPFCRFNLSDEFGVLIKNGYHIFISNNDNHKNSVPIPKSLLLSTFDWKNDPLILYENCSNERSIKYKLSTDDYILFLQIEETEYEYECGFPGKF